MLLFQEAYRNLARQIIVLPLLGMGLRIGNGESIIVASGDLGDEKCTGAVDGSW